MILWFYDFLPSRSWVQQEPCSLLQITAGVRKAITVLLPPAPKAASSANLPVASPHSRQQLPLCAIPSEPGTSPWRGRLGECRLQPSALSITKTQGSSFRRAEEEWRYSEVCRATVLVLHPHSLKPLSLGLGVTRGSCSCLTTFSLLLLPQQLQQRSAENLISDTTVAVYRILIRKC